MKKDRRRKINFSVKRKMQLRLLFKILTIIFVGIGLMGLVFYLYSNREISHSYRQFHVQAKNFLDYLLPAVIASLVIAFISSLAITIFFPHKIAGPLFRIERDIKERISKGDFTVRFKLRKGDEVHDLAEALNAAMESLSEKIRKMQKNAEEVEAIMSADNPDLDELRKQFEGLKREINSFKV